jgi:hypothetical protein
MRVFIAKLRFESNHWPAGHMYVQRESDERTVL